MTNKIEQFLNDKFGEVGAVKIDNVIWFVASDIAKVLGYTSTQKVTDLVDNTGMRIINIETNGGVQNSTCIDSESLHKVLSSTRKCAKVDKQIIYKWLTGEDFYNTVTKSNKESEFIHMLEEALKPFGLRGYKQFKVLDKYRLDLYIPSLDIAVEYDENSHNHYLEINHKIRQKEIEEELGFYFIRVSDSHTDAYNVGLVISKIIDKMIPVYTKEAVKQYIEFNLIHNEVEILN